jgi:dolichol-phosphate mannosyltransferase
MMIWILLPAYNESASLPQLLPKIEGAMTNLGVSYRVVVVEDGSYDGTADLLEQYRNQWPLDVVKHPINRGLGETERDGFEYVAAHGAPEDILVRLDCDDTHEPEYIMRLLARLDEGFDVVNTSRFQPGGDQLGVSRYRAFISLGANLFMRLVFGIKGVRDYSCGFRAYRVRVIQDAVRIFGNNFVQLRGLGFTSTLETIVKLRLLGCRFAEVPFVLRYDQKVSESKMVSSITTLGYLIMAVLYHWPFGGWRSQYKGLDKLYRQDPAQGVAIYNPRAMRLRTASRIGL